MAGLLDYIVPGSDGGELIDFLKRNVAGLPADYQIADDQSQQSMTPDEFRKAAQALLQQQQANAQSVPLPPAPTVPDQAINSGLLGSLGQSQGFPGDTPPAAPPSAFDAAAAALGGAPGGPNVNPIQQPDASPIAVGNNYMMPRIGGANLFASQSQGTDNAALPPNSQPVQGQGLPPGVPSPIAAPGGPSPMLGRPVSGFLNRAANALQSMSNGGSMLGAVRGQFDDPKSLAAQTGNMTARALIAKGVDPQTAIAAVQPGNTEMLKTLMPILSPATYAQETDKDGNVWNVNKLTGQKTVALQQKDDKFTSDKVKNPDGSETVRPFNQKTGEYGAPVSAPKNAGSVDPGLTGQPRMDAIMAADPNYGRKIQAMVNGDLPLPTSGQAARSPQAQKMVEDALAVSGTTSASDFATKAATRKDYASGIASRVTKSLNTTIKHAGQLDSDVDKLHNYTYFPSVTNYIHDKYSNSLDPEYQKAKAKFEEDKEAFVKELDFTLSGGHSSVSGSAELRDKINRADSPGALHAAIQSALHLLSARLDSHTQGFNNGMKSQRDGQDFIYPENREIFNRLLGSSDTSTGGEVPGVSQSKTAAPAVPSLKVGQSATIGNVTIKKIGEGNQ